MNTFLRWLRSFHFVQRVEDVALVVYSWIGISMFWLLAITVLLAALPIVLIMLVLVLVFRQEKVSIYVKRSTPNRTRSFNVGTRKK